MHFPNILGKFLIWRVRHISQRQLVLFLSLIIGIIGGLAAIILKNTVFYTNYFLTYGFDVKFVNFLYLAYPLTGIFLTVLFVRYFARENISHGISHILYAISRKNSQIKSHNMYSSVAASTLTGGFGGSIGMEAPIVLTGAAFGSNIGRFLRLNYKVNTLLIGCGAAAAIAGIFKAPIAAVIFALEVLMLDLTTASIVPLLISAVTGATVANFLLGKGVVFYFSLKDPFILYNIPFYILLGIITGFVSVYFTRMAIFIDSSMERIRNVYSRLIVGGIVLGLLIFLFPPLYGEGYTALKSVLSGNFTELANNSIFYSFKDHFWYFTVFVALIIIFKVIAMAITTGSGGVGGIFAPSLFIGGLTGFLFSSVVNYSGIWKLSTSNFSLVGMAGMISGVMAAPLTAIFLIAEITSGYELFTPLIVTSTLSFLTTKYFEPHSIYSKQLAKRGELITHDKDKAVLTLMRLGKVIETDFRRVNPETTLGELVQIIAMSRRNLFPVVDQENNFLGIVLLDHIRHIMFRQDMYNNTLVSNLMITPSTSITSEEDMDSVMKKFEISGDWNMPVIDNGKYTGFVSKANIFSAYRKVLQQFSEE